MPELTEDKSEAYNEEQERRADSRKSRSIRFSDSEWDVVESAASRQGIPAAEYVRNAAMDAATGRIAILDAEMVETIRRIFRSTHILITLKRDEMVSEGRSEKLEEMIKDARETQSLLKEQTSS